MRQPLETAGGIMLMADVYCLYNRARGEDLISPEGPSVFFSVWVGDRSVWVWQRNGAGCCHWLAHLLLPSPPRPLLLDLVRAAMTLNEGGGERAARHGVRLRVFDSGVMALECTSPPVGANAGSGGGDDGGEHSRLMDLLGTDAFVGCVPVKPCGVFGMFSRVVAVLFAGLLFVAHCWFHSCPRCVSSPKPTLCLAHTSRPAPPPHPHVSLRITAAEVAAALDVPLVLAREQLGEAEGAGLMARDDGVEGTRFFRNAFGDWV